MSDFRDAMQATAVPMMLGHLGDAVLHYPGGDARDTADPVEVTAIVDLSEQGEPSASDNTRQREAIPIRGFVTVPDSTPVVWEDRYSRKSRFRLPVAGGFEPYSVVRRVDTSGGLTTYAVERTAAIGTRETSR